MKKTTILVPILVWLLFLGSPHSINAFDKQRHKSIPISPDCQAFFDNPKASLQDPNAMTCLITAYIKNHPYAYVGEKDLIPSSSKASIVSSNIPEGQSCTKTKPCPVGHVTFSDGTETAVNGTCLFPSKDSSDGSCTYSEQKTFKHIIKGVDFAEISTPSNIISNIQNPSILLNTQFKKLLSTENQIKTSLQLLAKTLPPTEVPQKIGSIPDTTKFLYMGEMVTFKQVKDSIPQEVWINFGKNNWKLIYQQYYQDAKQDKDWTKLITALPLSPSPNAEAISDKDSSSTSTNLYTNLYPGATYNQVRVTLGGKTIYKKGPIIDSIPEDPFGGLSIGALVALSHWYLTSDQINQIKKEFPLAKPFFLDEKPQSITNFVKHNPFTGKAALTTQEYGNLALHSSNEAKKLIIFPKKIDQHNIEEAKAVATEGFPANTLAQFVYRVLRTANIGIEKQFLIVPAIPQQVADYLFTQQLRFEMSSENQDIVDQEINHKATAAKGSLYPNGLSAVHLYQSRNFSFILSPDLPYYCSYQNSISDYMDGICTRK